jgi:hypothetical protein
MLYTGKIAKLDYLRHILLLHGGEGEKALKPHTWYEKLTVAVVAIGIGIAALDTMVFEYAHPELGNYDFISSLASFVATAGLVVFAIFVYDRHKEKEYHMRTHPQ